MADNAYRYSFSLTAEGWIDSIRKDDGVEVQIHGESQPFCDFLTWLAAQPEELARPAGYGGTRGGEMFFADRARLIDHCKASSVMIHLSGGGRNLGAMEPGPVSIPVTGVEDSISFYPLNIAIPAAGPSWVPNEGVQPEGSRIYVARELYEGINNFHLQEEDSDIRRLSNSPVERAFVYVDVSGFSKHPVAQQVLIINALVSLTNHSEYWPPSTPAGEARADREASLCIGDGYIFVFRNAWAAAYSAAYVAQLIETLIAKGKLLEFHFRISVHVGPVYRFWDRWGEHADQGRWNYVGRGITDGERVLSAIGADRDDVVFVSAETRMRIAAAPGEPGTISIRRFLQNRGRQADKHGQFRRLYEVNHTAWVGDDVDRLLPEILTRAVGT
jgi:hypothetical protein